MSRSDYGKWIGGVVGFMQFGFIGAIIGYQLGKMVGKNFGTKQKMFESPNVINEMEPLSYGCNWKVC